MTENEPTFDFCSFIEQECAKGYDAKKKFLIKILYTLISKIKQFRPLKFLSTIEM